MEAARNIEDEPDPHEGRLSHLSAAQRAEAPSEEYDVQAGWELESGDVVEFVDRDPRPVVAPDPPHTPLTEVSGAIDFDKVAAVMFEPEDSPESVIRRLRETGMVYTDEGDVSMAAYQLDVLRHALQGNEIAFEELPEDNGLQQWVDANRDSEHAVAVFEQLFVIMHRQPEDVEAETEVDEAHILEPDHKPRAEMLVDLLQRSPAGPAPEPAPEPTAPEQAADDRHASRTRPRRRDRIRRRLRPLLGH